MMVEHASDFLTRLRQGWRRALSNVGDRRNGGLPAR
jgi:hypothetical protein